MQGVDYDSVQLAVNWCQNDNYQGWCVVVLSPEPFLHIYINNIYNIRYVCIVRRATGKVPLSNLSLILKMEPSSNKPFSPTLICSFVSNRCVEIPLLIRRMDVVLWGLPFPPCYMRWFGESNHWLLLAAMPPSYSTGKNAIKKVCQDIVENANYVYPCHTGR